MRSNRLVYETVFITILLTVAAITPLKAGVPQFWEVSRQEDITKGNARGVSISATGAITLAPAFTLVYDTKEAYIWSSASDDKGNIYLGTGHEGRVFKVDSSGTGRLLFDAPELDVTSLATDPAGNLYAGTSPDGKIYKITPDGKSSVFFDPPDKYIWALAFDVASSTLYAGTGTKGIIYKIDQTGKGSVLVDTIETNIMSLALDKSGALIAGTDPTGLVLRITADGKMFALLDSPLQEIHSLAVRPDGYILALGISAQAGPAQRTTPAAITSGASSGEAVVTISASDDQDNTVTLSTSQSTDLSGLLSTPKGQGSKSAVFMINPEGTAEALWSTRDAVGFSMKLLSDGRVLVGTGSKGRIYRVESDRTSTVLIQSPEDQTSTIISAGDKLYATSSNLGRLYRIGPDPVEEGTYTSQVKDAKFAALWGVISWRGIGNIELQTRSGNTENPDSTWSDWSAPYRMKTAERITSARARFIQWRATLRNNAPAGKTYVTADSQGASTQLQSVTVSYLPRNQAPDISSVSVLPAGVAFQEIPSPIDPSIAASGLDTQLFGVQSNLAPRRYYQKGARSIMWQGTDPNDDSLTYNVYYRAVNETAWHLLVESLSTAYYTIDASRLPDGAYFFKIVASDSLSNPQPLALTSDEVSSLVEIDNTPPVVKANGVNVNGLIAEVIFDASDSTSRIIKGEYSVDGGIWRMIFPVDGIADSTQESFKVRAELPGSGEHVIAFRCSDSSLNIGSAKVAVVAK